MLTKLNLLCKSASNVFNRRAGLRKEHDVLFLSVRLLVEAVGPHLGGETQEDLRRDSQEPHLASDTSSPSILSAIQARGTAARSKYTSLSVSPHPRSVPFFVLHRGSLVLSDPNFLKATRRTSGEGVKPSSDSPLGGRTPHPTQSAHLQIILPVGVSKSAVRRTVERRTDWA